jgi:hypothetical protein
MPCIPIPKPPIPSVPLGLSISAPLPSPPQVTVQAPCCLLPPFTSPTIPISLGPLAVNPAIVAAIRVALQALEEWSDLIPLTCPRS